jgi:hypothetical protein
MSWPTDYDDKEGEEAALGASSDPEESLNKLSVSGWDFESEIYWEGERGLSL